CLRILTHDGSCSDAVTREQRVFDRSKRGRWRPKADVLRRLRDARESMMTNKAKPGCSVKGCTDPATVRVILYDVYSFGNVFFEQDRTCPYLCEAHVVENEQGAKSYDMMPSLVEPGGAICVADTPCREPELTEFRKGRGVVYYPHTN